MNYFSADEQVEASRHDRIYISKHRPYVLSHDDIYKFDKIKYATNGYIYSVKSLGDVEGKNILDLGCGNGYLSVILAKRGANVDAIDISTEAIKSARIMARINNIDDCINFKTGSAYDLDYPENYFDFIIGQAILHHLKDKARLVNPLYRVLKKGGKAVFFEAFGDSLYLEKFRLLVPVPVQEEDKTHWNEQLKYRDLDVFRERFILTHKEFQLLSRLNRLFNNKFSEECFGIIDIILLKYFKCLRRYARTIVVELLKP